MSIKELQTTLNQLNNKREIVKKQELSKNKEYVQGEKKLALLIKIQEIKNKYFEEQKEKFAKELIKNELSFNDNLWNRWEKMLEEMTTFLNKYYEIYLPLSQFKSETEKNVISEELKKLDEEILSINKQLYSDNKN